jgi:hypothetical protein
MPSFSTKLANCGHPRHRHTDPRPDSATVDIADRQEFISTLRGTISNRSLSGI